MPPTFVFVRHGEAEHNVEFMKEGEDGYKNPKYKDSRLTEVGVEQALQTKEHLSHISFLEVWSSPLNRCIQTAMCINNDNKMIFLHDSLIERLGGGHVCNERKAKTEINSEYPNCSTIFLPHSPPIWVERERNSSVYFRVFGFLALLRELYKNNPKTDYILLVTHHDVIEALLGMSLKNGEYVFVE